MSYEPGVRAGGYARPADRQPPYGSVPIPEQDRRGRGTPEEPRVVVAAKPSRRDEVLMTPVRGPRHERHMLERAELDAMALPVGDDGVVIGQDQNRRPAVVGLFRPKAVDGIMVAGSYMAQLIALRAAATGARVVVETARPELWGPLAQNAGGGQQVVSVVPVRRVGALGASASSPVLLIRDCGVRPPKTSQVKTAWQTTFTLVPYLDPGFALQLGSADLVALQRISPQEASLVARLVRLGGQDVQTLPGLPDEVVLWCARHGRQYVYNIPTQLESGLLGAPRRLD
jgi:hypothetical protein